MHHSNTPFFYQRPYKILALNNLR